MYKLHVLLLLTVRLLMQAWAKHCNGDEGGEFLFHGGCVTCREICGDSTAWEACRENGCQVVPPANLTNGERSSDSVTARWLKPEGFVMNFTITCSSGSPDPATILANGSGPFTTSCIHLRPDENVTITIMSNAGSESISANITQLTSSAPPVTTVLSPAPPAGGPSGLSVGETAAAIAVPVAVLVGLGVAVYCMKRTKCMKCTSKKKGQKCMKPTSEKKGQEHTEAEENKMGEYGVTYSAPVSERLVG